MEIQLGGDAVNRTMECKKRRATFSKKYLRSTVLNMLRVPSTCWNLDRVFYVVRSTYNSQLGILLIVDVTGFVQLTILTFS